MTGDWKDWEGHVVDGKFRLRQYLGGCEHSAVFLTDYGEPEPRRAAIKLVPADPESAALQLSRWERAAKLSHPHLIRLFQIGRCQLDNTGLLYVVMEYAEEDLSQVLPHRPLAPAEAFEMIEAILGTLAYLHSKGFVHGHLKPANVMGVNDRLKISSDGVCRPIESSVAPGNLGIYHPPEFASGVVSPAGDVWSLGVTLVEALTQRLPAWEGTEQEDPVLPGTLPAPFVEIARRCLRRDPQLRWTVSDMAARLRQISPARQGQEAATPLQAFAKRPYIVGITALGLALAVMVVGPRLVARRVGGRQASSIPFEQPKAHIQAEPAPATPGTGQSTKTASDEAPAPFRSQADAKTSAGPLAPGEVVQQVLPDVPAKARNSIRGKVKVRVRVRVDPSGSVTDAKLDSAGPSRYFATLALQAARRWKFRPAQIDGRDVLSEWVLRFEFLKTSTKVFPMQVGP